MGINLTALQDLYDNVYDSVNSRGGVPELPLPLETVNSVSFGWPKRAISIVAGRPSHGKTAFMDFCALHLAQNGKNVIVVSLEDSKERKTERMLCCLNNINNYDLKKGDSSSLNPVQDKSMLEKLSMLIVDDRGYSYPELFEIYDNAIFDEKGTKADIIFLDYIQLIDKADHEIITEYMKRVQAWVKSHDVALVLGCQKNRQTFNAPTGGTGYKGAGAIEECAFMTIDCFYPYKIEEEGFEKFKTGENEVEYNNLSPEAQELVWKSYLEVSVSKNKDGETKNRIPIEFYGQHYSFRDWSSPVEIWQKQLGNENDSVF